MASRDATTRLHFRDWTDRTRTLCGRRIAGNIGVRVTTSISELDADRRPCSLCKGSRLLDGALGNQVHPGH